MLEQQQLIVDLAALALFDQLALQVEAGLIVEKAKPANRQRQTANVFYIHASSNFSSRSFM